MPLPLRKWQLHGLLKQAEKKRKLIKPNTRFKFWLPLESASLHAPELSHWLTGKHWLFRSYLYSQCSKQHLRDWLVSSLGHLHFPPTLQIRLCSLWGCSLMSSPLKQPEGIGCDIQLWNTVTHQGLSTQGQALAALIFSPLFSFNSKDRHELILAMTPTYLELSISSNHC